MIRAGRLAGKAEIGLRIGRVINKYKVAKHFALEIEDGALHYRVRAETVAAEAALDGVYVVRTSVSSEVLSSEDTVRAYKRLTKVERAFRSMKTIDLKVRPVYHRLSERVRAHIFLCMLAYYVEWHMRRALAPLLFDDEEDGEHQVKRAATPDAQHGEHPSSVQEVGRARAGARGGHRSVSRMG
jgi:transposase